MHRRLGTVSLLALATAGPAAAAPAPWPSCTQRAAPIRIGLTQVGRSRSGRMVTLRLRSLAMGDVQTVNVLLPRGYAAAPRRRFAVLYLLHGAGGSYASWTKAELATVDALRAIVVMPSGTEHGVNGDYSDWFGLPAGQRGRVPAWESFHIRELVPFVDHHYRTRPAPGGRAIAGISMGGGGALKYAAEFPGTFGYAASFSGSVYIDLPLAQSFQPKTCVQGGDPSTHATWWHDNDPTYLAANLRGVRVFVRSGTGQPGPFDPQAEPTDPGAKLVYDAQRAVEYGAHLEAQGFVRAARTAGVRDVDARFFPGTHSRPYWDRDLREMVVWLRRQLRRPPRPRTAFTVVSAHRWFTAWGWTFAVHRRGHTVLTVRVRRGGVRVGGAGAAGRVIVTPPHGRPFAVDLAPPRSSSPS